tara:strand:- start:53 stop:295 length:243 start_codon:yes stop_codon:yes gene_type:complete
MQELLGVQSPQVYTCICEGKNWQHKIGDDTVQVVFKILQGGKLGSAFDLIGINIATSTPASVACTPDLSMAIHMMIPITM